MQRRLTGYWVRFHLKIGKMLDALYKSFKDVQFHGMVFVMNNLAVNTLPSSIIIGFTSIVKLIQSFV
jgi:hypothetical protein